MKVKFKKPLRFGKHVYKPGLHDVPDEHSENWFFKAHEVNGNILIVDKPAPGVAAPVATNEEAQAMVDSGEADIPADAIVEGAFDKDGVEYVPCVKPKAKKAKKAKEEQEG